MNTDKNLSKAIGMLRAKFNVIPERYTIYNNAYLFWAFPPGMKESDKERYIGSTYLVDVRTKDIGPFSPAFDFDGFFKAASNAKDI